MEALEILGIELYELVQYLEWRSRRTPTRYVRTPFSLPSMRTRTRCQHTLSEDRQRRAWLPPSSRSCSRAGRSRSFARR